jgi:hypothetical protein
MAVIMHLDAEDLPVVFGEIARVTKTGGVVAYSVNTARAGLSRTAPRKRYPARSL